MNPAISNWGVMLLGGAATGFLVWGLASFYREAIETGEDLYGDGEAGELPSYMRILLPYARAFAALADPWTARGTDSLGGRVHGWIQARIRHAGNPGELRSGEFLGLSGVGMVFGLLTGILMGWMLGPSRQVQLALAISGAALGGALPWVWLSDRINARRKRILRALPYAIDLMTLSIEAGLDFTVALARIGRKLKRTPLAREFGILLHEIQMGKTRKAALRDFKERVHLMDVDFFVSSLIQADEMGVGLGPVLRVQADGIRQRRFLRAEELATKAPVKIIFPLIAFIMPVTLVIILGPLAIQLWDQLGSMVTR